MKRVYKPEYDSLRYLLEDRTQGNLLTPSQRIESYHRNTLKIVTMRGTGTGILISHDGFFLTNHHVLHEDAKPLYVEMNGVDYRFPVERVIYRSRPHDLVLAKAPMSRHSVPNEVLFASRKSGNDQGVVIFGYRFMRPETSEGKTRLTLENGGLESMFDIFRTSSEKRTTRAGDGPSADVEANTVYTDCRAEEGWSGGPVVLKTTGELIGITKWNVEFHVMNRILTGTSIGHGATYVGKAREMIRRFLDKEE